jgi:LacI family transcriptional regulator
VKKSVSLKDVARHLGVSVALVSYVVNGKEREARVSIEMAAKIRKTLTDLNYQPNLIAKSLKSGKTNTIGLIVADISNPFFSSIARIIEDEAKKHGYVVIFGSSDESAKKSNDLVDVFLNRQVDAFIIAPAAGTEQQVRALQLRNSAVVLIDRYFHGLDTDSVRINNFDAAKEAVRHLIKNKKRRIAMLAYDSDLPHMQDRKNGYKAALKQAGIRFKRSWLAGASYHNIEHDAGKAMEQWSNPLQVDAVFFATNSLAVAGLKKINDLGIRVPEELAVISFDESDAFDFFYSPVSYVSQSVPDIGKAAVRLVIDRIRDINKKPATAIIKAKLVIRQSCGSSTL